MYLVIWKDTCVSDTMDVTVDFPFNMAIPVVEFSNGGYKFGKIFTINSELSKSAKI